MALRRQTLDGVHEGANFQSFLSKVPASSDELDKPITIEHSKDVQRRYRERTRGPKVSRQEMERQYRKDLKRIEREFREDEEVRKREQTKEKKKIAQKRKREKKEQEIDDIRAEKRRQGLPPVPPRPGQSTLSSFVRLPPEATRQQLHESNGQSDAAPHPLIDLTIVDPPPTSAEPANRRPNTSPSKSPATLGKVPMTVPRPDIPPTISRLAKVFATLPSPQRQIEVEDNILHATPWLAQTGQQPSSGQGRTKSPGEVSSSTFSSFPSLSNYIPRDPSPCPSQSLSPDGKSRSPLGAVHDHKASPNGTSSPSDQLSSAGVCFDEIIKAMKSEPPVCYDSSKDELSSRVVRSSKPDNASSASPPSYDEPANDHPCLPENGSKSSRPRTINGLTSRTWQSSCDNSMGSSSHIEQQCCKGKYIIHIRSTPLFSC